MQGHQLPGNFVQGSVRRKDSNTLPPRLAQEKQVSLSWSNRSCFPLVVMLHSRLGTRTKTSQTRAVAVYPPLYQGVTFPKMIDVILLRFRFDRPFRNQFSELAPRPQHYVQKIPSNGCTYHYPIIGKDLTRRWSQLPPVSAQD